MERITASFPRGLLGDMKKMLFNPGAFYENLPGKGGMRHAFLFLLCCSLIFSIMSALFAGSGKIHYAALFFLNAAAMPLLTALVFYVAGLFLCKGIFTYASLFRVTAYANVTCLLAWIPGIAWATGLWSFYLVGLGMIKTGNISKFKALAVILSGGGLMLLLIQIIYPVLGGLNNGS